MLIGIFISRTSHVGLVKQCLIFEPAHDSSVLTTFSSNEGSGELARKRRLARAFEARIQEA